MCPAVPTTTCFIPEPIIARDKTEKKILC
jgi:hypothetical protein